MIKVAVAGPGSISRRFLDGMKDIEHATVTVFASRNPERVRDYAAEHGIERIDSFSALCNDPSIDAFYISTPNYVHYEMIREALLAGKHVLCEKPITVTRAELAELFELAHRQNLVLMEAHKTLYTPVFHSIQKLLEEQRLGRILSASAGFCRNDPHTPGEWRLTVKQGGGALYDVGCYGLAELFGLFGTDLELTHQEAIYKGDVDVQGTLSFQKGSIPMQVFYSFVEDGDCCLRIRGEQGELVCPFFWKADRYTVTIDGKEEVFHFPFRSEFTFEILRFLERIEKKETADAFSEGISLRIMEILDTSLTIDGGNR